MDREAIFKAKAVNKEHNPNYVICGIKVIGNIFESTT